MDLKIYGLAYGCDFHLWPYGQLHTGNGVKKVREYYWKSVSKPDLFHMEVDKRNPDSN
jgi:hypothetical protein